MKTNLMGHCPQTDGFDQIATRRDIGTITIGSNTIELVYMHEMACHLRSVKTLQLWQLRTHYVNGVKGGPSFQVPVYPAGVGAKQLRRPPEATLPSAGSRGRAHSATRAPAVARAVSGKDAH